MTTTVAWSTVQWGTFEAGVWTPLAMADGIEARPSGLDNRLLAFIVELPNPQLSGTRILDAPVVSGVKLQLPTLEVGALPNDRQVRISVGLTTTTDDYSTASPPLSRGETTAGTFIFQGGGTLIPMVVPLEIQTSIVTEIRRVTSSAFWDGRLSFVVESLDIDAGFRVLNGPSNPLTTDMDQDLFFGGRVGGGEGRIRAVRDSRYGMPAWNHELVRDGDNPGLFVRAWDVDPEDEEAQYKPKPDEGTVTDEVPS